MKKETEEWIRIAIEDFQAAKYLLEKSLYRMVCYHAQQTVEKLPKAILVERDIDIPRTHNLLDLNNAIRRLGYNAPLLMKTLSF
jgi:HEPN domain-containing protein